MDLKRVANGAFYVGGAMFLHFRWRCWRSKTSNLWKACDFWLAEIIFCRHHFSWQVQGFVCLGCTFSWQAQCFVDKGKNRKSQWNCEVKDLLQMSNLTEVSQNIVVFKLSTSNNLGSLAELLRFQAFNLQMWRKDRRKALFSSFHLAKLQEVSHKMLVFLACIV